jgi:hypothetical protein
MASALRPLTNRQQDICIYGGLFGVLITITCLIQHLTVANSEYVFYTLIASAFLFIIISFCLLAFQKPISLIFLCISILLSIGIEIVWMKGLAFSLIVLILFLYTVIIVIVVYAEQIPLRLKQKKQAELEEAQRWKGKI